VVAIILYDVHARVGQVTERISQ